MSANKQKIQQAVGDMKMLPLCRAIEKIPSQGGGYDGREAFTRFMRYALHLFVVANRDKGEPFMAVEADLTRLGCPSLESSEPLFASEAIEHALTVYLQAVKDNEPFTDLLSAVHTYFMGSKKLDQCMSPWQLAKNTALFVRAPIVRGLLLPCFRIADPTCGAGALLLAVLQSVLQLSGEKPFLNRSALKCEVFGNDLDPLCATITTLQLMASQWVHGCYLGVVHVTVRNALALEEERDRVFLAINHNHDFGGQE